LTLFQRFDQQFGRSNWGDDFGKNANSDLIEEIFTYIATHENDFGGIERIAFP
jgi:hypothetical protein